MFAVNRSRRIVNNFGCSALSFSICEKTCYFVIRERDGCIMMRSVIERVVDHVLQFVVSSGHFVTELRDDHCDPQVVG